MDRKLLITASAAVLGGAGLILFLLAGGDSGGPAAGGGTETLGKCPVCGKPPTDQFGILVDGKRVYFDTMDCKLTFRDHRGFE